MKVINGHSPPHPLPLWGREGGLFLCRETAPSLSKRGGTGVSFLCKKIFPILFLLSALFLLFCSQPEPTRVPVNSDEFCSGDTLCVRLRYELKDDTAALSYGTGLEITMQLRNTAARALTLDSLPVETYVEIVPDSSGNPSSV